MKIETKIEGLLYLFGDEGVAYETLLEVCNQEEQLLKSTLKLLENKYNDAEDAAFDIKRFGNIYKMTTKAKHSSFYEHFFTQVAKHQLSNAALEVLAIIAYKQPITRAEIEHIRGVQSDAIIRKLQLFQLIEVVGKEEGLGTPQLFGVSQYFLDYFGLVSLAELPQLKETSIEEIRDDLNIFMTKYQEKLDVQE